ncbi:MAG: SPOR domain-containing protein [Sphingomonadales bacterium]|nr:MAG: SPOR domain-containing protein [Sphingomonadales bacterium]
MRNFAIGALVGFGASVHIPANALQSTGVTSREVAQPLPSAEVERLRDALQRLASQPRDLNALVSAGEASLAVGDFDAALGFFGRALELSPNSAQAKLGMASVYLRSGRATDALRMFDEAERAGASTDALLGEWGLAQDLVGNNQLAQEGYRAALATKPEDEITRRLALSLAISGDRTGFDTALLPLLQKQDKAAWRARAFGLAILGDTEEAADLVRRLMPPDLAGRMSPYLAYMPRLTKAQQAAAANLGIFPRAAQIGRDSNAVARLASSTDASVSRADSRLAPTGTPLGRGNRPPSRLEQITIEQAERRESVSEAFNGLAGPAGTGGQAQAGAVDISSIEIPREQSKPEPPRHPSRHWVQLATGRDRSALAFDWRRMVRRAPALLGEYSAQVTRWGQANRLLAGPFDSRDDARELVRQLRAQGFDSFAYTSPDGEEITELK